VGKEIIGHKRLQTSHLGVFVCGAFSSPKEISETIIDASGAAGEVMRLLNDRLNTYPHTRQWPFLPDEDLPSERDVSGEPARIGVFACSCGGTIGEVLDMTAVARQAGTDLFARYGYP
jgi:heterodisulfide reductase subunit A